jgi:hypothetical protein
MLQGPCSCALFRYNGGNLPPLYVPTRGIQLCALTLVSGDVCWNFTMTFNVISHEYHVHTLNDQSCDSSHYEILPSIL